MATDQHSNQDETQFSPGTKLPGSDASALPEANGHRTDVEVEEEAPKEMGFFDHLEELRWRIIKAAIALILCAIGCGIFYKEITESILMRPAIQLGDAIRIQNIEVMGQLTLAIQVCLISGFILSVPFILWQFWGFIQPGLYKRERRYAGVLAVATIFCFVVGVTFAYFVMIPTAFGFAAGFQVASNIENIISISSYFSFVLGLILACGLIFEMPMLSYALSRFGIVTPVLLRKYRRHAVVLLLIVAAIITPTPDPVNQLMLAGPLYILYEISIIVSRFAKRQRKDAMEDVLATEDQVE